MSKGYAIGVDGGGTKTLTHLANLSGRVLNSCRFGPSNYYAVGRHETLKVFKDMLAYYQRENGLDLEQLRFISLGIAGVDREIDKKTIHDMLKGLGLKCDIYVYNDATTGLVGALEKTEGVGVVSGTGSIAVGMKKGKLVRAGGWGHILGDEGSGYGMGMQALKTMMQAYDGRLNRTKLTDRILYHLKLDSPEDLIGFVHDPKVDKKRIAELAPVIAATSDEGDDAAAHILEEASVKLFELAKAVIDSLYNKEEVFELVLLGGIMTQMDQIREPLSQRILEAYPKVMIKKPAQDGAIGALYLGWEQQKGL